MSIEMYSFDEYDTTFIMSGVPKICRILYFFLFWDPTTRVNHLIFSNLLLFGTMASN